MSTTIPCFKYPKRCIQYLINHPHKPILYPSNSYHGSNFIILTCSGDQVEDYITQNCLGRHQYSDHALILNRRIHVSGIIHTILGVSLLWTFQIKSAVASASTGEEIHYMYKSIKNTKDIQRYMEDL